MTFMQNMDDRLYRLLSQNIAEVCLFPSDKLIVIDKNVEAGAERFDYPWRMKEQILSALACPPSLFTRFMDETIHARTFENRFEFSIPYCLISMKDLCPVLPNAVDWNLFRKLYPHASRIVSCAWPVMDDSGEHALLHTGAFGSRQGGGGFSYYRKKGEGFLRMAIHPTWAIG